MEVRVDIFCWILLSLNLICCLIWLCVSASLLQANVVSGVMSGGRSMMVDGNEERI